MAGGLRRYEFGERLADILGESRRDLRFRVTLMVTGGLLAPGPRGRGSPPATPAYAADFLVGIMAAPQQAHTVEAIRCYRDLQPTVMADEVSAPKIVSGPSVRRAQLGRQPAIPLVSAQLHFGEVLARLLELARAEETRAAIASSLYGIWVSRGFPAAAIQLGAWSGGRRSLITRRYELAEGARPPAWLNPSRGGLADPGLLHTVFLPAAKLVEVGTLTTLPEERGSPMLNIGPKMATIRNLASLAHQARHRRRWEKLLAVMAAAQAWTDKVDTSESRLVEVTDFGSNPGNLRMLTYMPETLHPSPALVVVLHGATQTAASYDKGTGWSTLADRFGFALLLPQQHWTNNPLRAFNWFRTEDIQRDGGEPLSIMQMVQWMVAEHGIDPGRVYVTGVSSGGAMTSVMLATYPERFAGGAVIAGVPYRAAEGLQEAFESIFQGRGRSAEEWGDLVRAACGHQGPWPRVSVWHGDADSSVKPINAHESVKQWTDLHGLGAVPAVEQTVAGYPYRAWHNPDGDAIVESYTITGMSHGAPVEPGDQEHQCGTAAPYFLDVGISSTYQIARFFGLAEKRPEWVATVRPPLREMPTPEPAFFPASAAVDHVPTIHLDAGSKAPSTDVVGSEQKLDVAAEELEGDRAAREDDVLGVIAQSLKAAGLSTGKHDGASDRRTKDAAPNIDVHRIITKSLEAAGLLHGSREGSAEQRSESGAPLGIDVSGIIRTSLEAAGMLTGSRPTTPGGAPLGIDVPGIIATSLEAAGLFTGGRDASHEADVTPSGSAPFDWEGDGWQFLADDVQAFRDGPLLFGHAVSGSGCDVGNKVQSVSRKLSLGRKPELSYVRRLNLRAGVNDYTKASFSVLVDGLPVDEVSAVGMDHSESEWMQRTGIDLTPFCDRTVTLTLQVAANSNVCQEVSAKAWVERINVRDTAVGQEC
jgi:feruloyl esterase